MLDAELSDGVGRPPDTEGATRTHRSGAELASRRHLVLARSLQTLRRG